jgi:hypothetical protein
MKTLPFQVRSQNPPGPPSRFASDANPGLAPARFPRSSLGWLAGFIVALALLDGTGRPLLAAFVYETPTEFLTSGDFNGDGAIDALVIDKATGNARVGYMGGGSQINWAGPLPTGAENLSGAAAGRFLNATRDGLAVTAPSLNRVHLVDLFSPGSNPTNLFPAGLGPHALAALRAPFGAASTYHALLVASSANNSNGERGDLLTLNAGAATFAAELAPSAPFERLNAIEPNPATPTMAVGLLRGSTDALQYWRFSPATGIALTRSNLPTGSEYVFGRFLGEALPRFVFYRPGESQLTMQALQDTPQGWALAPSQTFALPSPLQRVYYADLSGAGLLILHFTDGVRGARPPAGGGASLEFIQDFAPGAGFAFSGFVPLGDGRFSLLSSRAGDSLAARAQVFQWNGATFASVSTNDLPAVTSAQTRSTVWLFAAEPFVNRDPNFLYSVSAPDWTTNVTSGPGFLTVRRQVDGGSTTGLNGGSPTNFASGGANYGIPNQYHPAISIFSYNGARPIDPVYVRIAPPPGAYPGPINVTFSTGSPISDGAYYRLDGGAYRTYVLPVTISNDVTITYYASNIFSRLRSRLATATYTFGRPAPAPPITDPTVVTNLPPVTPPASSNDLALSVHGTVFYGRRSAANVGTIWSINLDGSNDRFITTGARPRVSPNGRYLAFQREGNPFNSQGNVWMRDLLTGGEWRLFVNADFIIGFNWNIDSSTLFFDYACALLRMGTNGSATFLPMTNDCNDDAPAVNPRDGRIAFHNLSGNIAIRGLYLTDPGGGVRRRLPIAGPATWPAWSPDGRQIAFADSLINGVLNSGPDLFVVNPDGTGLFQITSLGGANGFLTGAQWAPDSDALVAAGSIFNNNGLWLIPLTADRSACASAPIRLPTSPGDGIDFAGTVLAAPRLPELFIRREVAEGTAVISWRQSRNDFVLEVSTGLGPVATWSPIAGPYTVSGNFHEVRFAESTLADTTYFRLRLP